MITPRALGRQIRTVPGAPHLVLPRWWRHLGPAHLLWLAVWAPWWVGNELPPPTAPDSREPEMAEQPDGTAGAWLLDTMDDLALRFGLSWTAALLIRGAWLGGLTGIVWIAVAMLAGTPSPSVPQLAVAIGVGAALGLVLRLFHRPRYTAIALLLEGAFTLRSRLSTAILALRYGGDSPGELHALQLADAANSLDHARAQLRPVHWVPVREIFIAFIIALTLLLLLVARRPEGEIPGVSSVGFPAFVPVSERLAAQQQPVVAEVPDAATLQEVEDLSRVSNQARQDLEAIRDALDDTAQTLPAAEAMGEENYPAANERLSSASEAVTQLPESDRAALASQLEEAARRVSEDNAALGDSARRAAEDVRTGEDSGAIDELGDRIEETGEDVIPREAGGRDLSASAGESQSGTSGSSTSTGPEPPEPGEEGGGGEPGQSGDPGAGMEASGGTGESGESAQTSGDGAEGGDPSADAGGSGAGEEARQDGGGSGTGAESEGDRPGEPGGDSAGGEPSDEEGAQQGPGAGAGSSESDPEAAGEASEGAEGGALEDDDQEPGRGEAGDPPQGNGDGDGQDSGPTSGGGAIQLPGTSGERVASGSDVGASSVGSGGGVGAASGDSAGGASGSSGPDPNSVPAQWRDIVERYFREGGSP
jgi:hypothetical protein